MQKIYRAAAGLCLGYSFCHIFIQYFILELVFAPLDIRLGSGWGQPGPGQAARRAPARDGITVEQKA